MSKIFPINYCPTSSPFILRGDWLFAVPNYTTLSIISDTECISDRFVQSGGRQEDFDVK